MIVKLINVILWISDLKRQTNDSMLNEYRGYQWRMVVSAGGILFCLFCLLMIGWLFFSQEIPNTGQYGAILATLLDYTKLLVNFMMIACCFAFLVNAIQFWRFCRKYGIAK
jgi:hypothetical protein